MAEGAREETARLIDVLRSDQGVFEKAKACQRLAVIGTADAIPVLAGLLANEELAHYARFALEPMPDPAVDEVLRAAVGKLEGKLRIGVINSIGVRRDVGAQDMLILLLGSRDVDLASAAAAALGRVGSPAAADALESALAKRAQELGVRLGEAAIVCGETLAAAGKREAAIDVFAAARGAALPAHVRAAALRGEILTRGDDGIALLVATIRSGDVDAALRRVAYGAARELPGRRATDALAAALDGAPSETQVQILRALGDRGDRAALEAVLRLASTPETAVATRVAAIRALESLGDTAVVPRLARAATGDDPEITAAARETLARMGGDDVDGATLALLEVALRRGDRGRGTPYLRELVEMAGSRKIAWSVRLLREAAERDDESVRLTAIRSLGTTVGLDEFGVLVAALGASRGEVETAAIRDALAMASRRMPSPAECSRALAAAMDGAPQRAREALLGVFGAVGGPEALEVVVGATRAESADERRAALAALGEWPEESAVFALLGILPKLESAADRTKAYDAFRAIVVRLGFDMDRRIGACVDAMRLATTDEERALTIEALEGIPAPKTLDVLTPYLESATLRDAAASAMATICERLIRTRQRDAVAPAMRKVLAATDDAELRRRAERLVEQGEGN